MIIDKASDQDSRGASGIASAGRLRSRLRGACWLAAFGAPWLSVVAQAQTTHECGVLQGVVVYGEFRLNAETVPNERTFDEGSDLGSDTRIAEVVEEANTQWPEGWVLRTDYNNAGDPVDGIVRGEGWTLTCFNPSSPVVAPPQPPPAPPPFRPQPVEVALGESGDRVTLMTTEAGGFTHNGEAFRGGGRVTAENGNEYILELADGVWTAKFDAHETVVTLGITEETVTLVRAEDGTYWIDDMAVVSGETTVTALNGNEYTLAITTDAAGAITWTAMYVEPSTGSSSQSPTPGNPSAATITLTNLTPGQVMAPAIVIVHGEDALPVFTPGARASSALAMLAEDNQSAVLLSDVGRDPHVTHAQVLLGIGPNGTIRSGESASLSITLRPGSDQITVVASLTSTNDAFVGASGIPVPESGMVDEFLVAWDAGSEVNDESCTHIPGPPCGNYERGDQESASIVAHSGIHGHGDLAAKTFDWAYPAARITVKLAGGAQ